MKYDPHAIETKWQKKWIEDKILEAEPILGKDKYYCLEMFPYPSGKIHMGHIRNYAIGDVFARYKKMLGYSVLHPMGWDAFGLPAENAAIKNNIHPAKWTYNNIEYMRKQLKRLGLSYDWRREFATCDPTYYKWEQKFFIEMFNRGLAYKKKTSVNWCPECNTVLANEQVEDGKCWRCMSEVTQKELNSWFFKITDYADRLLEDMTKLTDWPERVLNMQRNWIGKSIGAEINFTVEDLKFDLTVFTTRPDTIFGATFIAISPKHPIVDKILRKSKNKNEIKKFIEDIDKDLNTQINSFDKQKKGFFTGFYGVNPANNKNIPLYIANFILMEYGTGAIMGVPAHDERDFEFAKEYGIDIIEVIRPENKTDNNSLEAAYTGSGYLVNSGIFNDMDNEAAKEAIIKHIKGAKKTINYRLRDWGISRQRYWGTPIPIVYCDNCGSVPVNIEELPVLLPEDVTFKGTGNPLESNEAFINTKCPKCGERAKRETDTMDTFVESSWYFIRFCSIKCDNAPFNEEDVKYFMPVNQYIGGIEHAILHLLYARFFTKVLKDLGYIDFDEPFLNLLTQGMVCKETYKCPKHGWLYPSEVEDNNCIHCREKIIVGRIEKMSKSKKNVVDPDKIIKTYGADTARLFVLFASPPEKDLEWSDEGIEGASRFINRVYRLILNNMDLYKCVTHKNDVNTNIEKTKIGELTVLAKDILYNIHYTIKKVTNDIERFQLNTAIAAIMEFTNFLYQIDTTNINREESDCFVEALNTIIILLSPFCPHICDELWHIIGHTAYINTVQWPNYNNEYLKKDELTLVVQVNGKVRAEISVNADITKEEALYIAKNNEKIAKYLENKAIRKEIYVPKKLVNFVIS
jgi:leucyl-tRNA synthetase